MKKQMCLLWIVALLLSFAACAGDSQPQTEPGVGETFAITGIRVETDISQAERYVRSTLSKQSFVVSEDAPLTISVQKDPEMKEGDYCYKVESTASVVIRGGSESAAAKGLAAFGDAYLLCESPCTSVGVWMTYTAHSGGGVESGILDWRLTEESEQLFANGVTYRERVYLDSKGLPFRAYILTADPQYTTIHYGTSGDDYTATPAVKQNVMQHMQASVANGYDVIAAVNGDFFAISGDYHPTGLAIKNGHQLTQKWAYGRPYTGVTKDGEYIIEYLAFQSDKTDHLLNAIGGNFPLILNGQVNKPAEDATMGLTRAPRTLAGLTEDGTLILAVIDGRQPSHSNGATFEEAAYFMLSLGAVKAVNHDGGGSSTFILRNRGNYLVMNSPSDGNLRKVFGSIQVVRKQQDSGETGR